MPTRVLILSWEYPPIVEGGLARHVRKLAEGLVRTGVEVHVLARGGGHLAAVEDRHGVIVHRVREPEFPKDDLDAFIAWVEHMNDDMLAAGAELGGGFDLVHSHDWLVAAAARMSSFMWPTHAMKASTSSRGKSGSRTRCTVTPWRSSTASRRPPPRVSTWTSCPSRTSCSDSLRTWRARPPSTIGGYSQERIRTRTAA